MLLEISKLNTFYGRLHALWDVDMKVKKGNIVALIGSNGAGKSTLLKSIAGTVRPRSGQVLYNGQDLCGLPANKIVCRGVTLSPEGRQIFPRMTIQENLLMGGYTRKKDTLAASFERAFELFPILKERISQQAGTLSGGEQQMLAIGRALMSNPDMLMLDEPSLGLSPILTETIFRLITEIKKQGVTILLIEQNAFGALSIADYGYVLENGKITLEGTGADLLNNEQVYASYLGGNA
ncbi:ABC transporter ATP-binding protein [Anaerotruncus colihominis]|uniref:ABC transporter ATP-binding protein n=1 Tax=Anaerotruncus colihominis TaxID=169435 RepID=UPI00189B34D0|nr:ABC transporter ATP-binding protein [Anaerotruncus colihominis]